MSALRYVDLNPVRARLVERALDYEWSSARAHLAGRDPTGLLDLDLWSEICPLGDWEGVLHEGPGLDTAWMDELRAATRAGKPLGSKEFIRELESRMGRGLELRSVGRPRKKEEAAGVAAGL